MQIATKYSIIINIYGMKKLRYAIQKVQKSSCSEPAHQPRPNSDINVACKESSQAADLLRFSLLHHQASTHMTILALPEASLHYARKEASCGGVLKLDFI